MEYRVTVNDTLTEWRYKNKLHRIDGPAVEWTNGTKEWFIDGVPHRTDGPALLLPDGRKFWIINGNQMTEEEFNKYVGNKTNCNGKIVEIDGVKYKLVALE